MENPIKMDDLGGTTIFGNTHIYIYTVEISFSMLRKRYFTTKKTLFWHLRRISVPHPFCQVLWYFFFGDRWKPRVFGRPKTREPPPNLGWWNITPPKFNIAPENCWLEDEFPFGSKPIFRGELLNFRGVWLHSLVLFVGLKPHLGLAPICCHQNHRKTCSNFGTQSPPGWPETKISNFKVGFCPKKSLIEVEFQILQGGGSLITSY